MKKFARAGRCIFLLLLLCILSSIVFFPASADGEDQEADLSGNIDEILSELDTDELQEYLDSLTDEQKELFGGSITEAIRSVIDGDFKLDYSNVLSAVAGLFSTV